MATATVTIPYMPYYEFDDSVVAENMNQLNVDYLSTDGNREIWPIIENLHSNRSIEGRGKFSKDVALILQGMGLENYIELFHQEDINLETFLKLTENDLRELGITNVNDQATILKNLKTFSDTPADNKSNEEVPYNLHDDLIMVKNIKNHLLVLKTYISYTILQLKKEKFTDYFVSNKETSVGIFKIIAKKLHAKSEDISQTLHKKGDDGLIKKITKMDNLVLPSILEKKLNSGRKPKKLCYKIFSLVTFICISSAAIIYGRQRLSVK